MTDKVYTQQELKEMADQLLAADDKKKAGKAAADNAKIRFIMYCSHKLSLPLTNSFIGDIIIQNYDVFH